MFYRYRTNIIFTMREQVQQLISQGRTEEALTLLAKHNGDAVLLQARYNQAKKQKNMGMLDFSEWSKVQAQVTYAALEMAGQINITNITNVQITINLNTAFDFEASIKKLNADTLVNLLTAEFTGKPAMEDWLPIKQDYESYGLLGKPFPIDYVSDLRKKALQIYKKYWVELKEKQEKELKSAVQEVIDSLADCEKNETVLRKCIKHAQVLYIENKGLIPDAQSNLETLGLYVQKLDWSETVVLKEMGRESYQVILEGIKQKIINMLNKTQSAL